MNPSDYPRVAVFATGVFGLVGTFIGRVLAGIGTPPVLSGALGAGICYVLMNIAALHYFDDGSDANSIGSGETAYDWEEDDA